MKVSIIYKDQIEHRIKLMEFHKAEGIKLQNQVEELINKKKCHKLANKQLSKQIKDLGFFPIDKSLPKNQTHIGQPVDKHITAKDVKNSAKELKNKERILVVDINYLPFELKDNNAERELREYLEELYNYKIILINTSKTNLQGFQSTNNQPIYFI